MPCFSVSVSYSSSAILISHNVNSPSFGLDHSSPSHRLQILASFTNSNSKHLNSMAIKSLLESNSLKFRLPLSLRVRKPSLIACKRFSNFKEHLTFIKQPQKDKQFKVEVNHKIEESPHPLFVAASAACSLPFFALIHPVLVFPFAILILISTTVNLVHYYVTGCFSGVRTGVLKLQVGLLGKGRSLQKDLNRVAKVADSSSYLLTETLVAMLRRLDCCISGYSCVDVKRMIEDGEKHFNRLSMEERGKIDEETLINVFGAKKRNTMNQRASGFNNEYIVVTIMVAMEGVLKLPAINGSEDLKEALQKLGSIHSNKIHAVEVLWTPQKKNVSLTEGELLEYYPLLRSF